MTIARTPMMRRKPKFSVTANTLLVRLAEVRN